jgi:hypothetical protein
MQDEISTAGFEPQLIVSQSNRQSARANAPSGGGGIGTLRDVPGLPLRVGRHLTAWVVWHTARVSLLSDSQSHGELDGRVEHSL